MSIDIKRFIDNEGKVTYWPKKNEARRVILEYLSSKFQTDHSYHEREINEILKKWHTFNDWPLLRRELSDRGYMNRNKSGTEYIRIK
jgi:hypothetical protein